MDEALATVMEQWERLQSVIGLGLTEKEGSNNNSSNNDKASSSSSSNVSESDINNNKNSIGTSSSSSNLAWWMTSLLFGVSSTIVYHWVRTEIRRRHLDESIQKSKKNLPPLVQQQAERLVQWTRTSVRKLKSIVAERSPSEVTLQLAMGTSMLLPDHLTVPWVLGCLVVSNGIWRDNSTGQDQLGGIEKYPPFLFLCFCPGRHRFQLWFTWMGLQLMGPSGSLYRPSLSRTSTSRAREGERTNENIDDAKEKTMNATVPVEPKEVSRVPSSSRYLEVLVHNVSHTDIILSLDAPHTDPGTTATAFESPFCLCRPRFSFMDLYCRDVFSTLSGKEELVQFPRYERCEDDPRYQIKDQPTGVPTPAGLALSPDPSLMADMNQVRVRGRDLARLDGTTEHDVGSPPCPSSPRDNKSNRKFPVNYVFFPLLATLLPRWRAQIEERKYPRNNVKRVLILVTGVGTPRNWTHSVTGNSTEVCAQLMERFLKRVDPNLTVVRIHSQTNIFRYDENLRFVDKEFSPIMHAWRDAHARGLPYPGEPGSSVASENPFNADWRNSMSVTLSAADGSTARTHAIRESLRPFRPTYFHFWQLKTFWHETKIVDDDLEVHSYETMETLPAVDAERLRDEQAQMVVEEMKAFRVEMMETLRGGKHDISKFWLRKTHKPVLAVLLVQSHGSRPVLYRGTNMEVSMPTGSLCAERNVIGTALAANPALKREDLKLIAVLAIPTLDEVSGDKSMRRVDSMASMGSTTLESNPDISMDRHMSIGSEQDEWVISSDMQQHPQGLDQSFAMIPPPVSAEDTAKGAESETTPVRKIRLFSKSAGRQKHNRSVVVQNSRDLNPLRPCGACNEWLKKIAESNPYFRIVTFTDAECHGVYCQPCQQ